MKIKLLSVIISSALFLSACGSDDTMETENLEKAQSEKTEQSIDNKYSNLSELPTTFKDSNAQEVADEAIAGYKANIKQIETEFSNHIQTAKEDVESNLMQLKSTLKNEQMVYNDKCSTINASNEKNCNSFKKSLTELKNKIAKVESDLVNTEKELNSEKKNEMEKAYINLKNYLNKLKVDSGEK